MTASPRRVLPGFGLSTGFTVLYLCLVVLVPLSTLAFRSSALSAKVRLEFCDMWIVVSGQWSVGSRQ